MGFIGRIVEMLQGRAKTRIPEQLQILGAPIELIEEAKAKPALEQEEILLRYVEGKHAAILDWRATGEDLYEELAPLLTLEERGLLPPREELPDDVSLAIASIRRAFASAPRALVHTESFGDFSLLFLVPRDREAPFVRSAGAWVIPSHNPV